MKGTHISRRTTRRLGQGFPHTPVAPPARPVPPPPRPAERVGLDERQYRLWQQVRAAYQQTLTPVQRRQPIPPGLIAVMTRTVETVEALVWVARCSWERIERQRLREEALKRLVVLVYLRNHAGIATR